MTLARASNDPALKQYYEELALGFVEKAASEPESDNTAELLDIIKPPIAATPIGTGVTKPSAIYPRSISPRRKSP